MSYLKFDKTLLINLEESLSREVLRTNRKGAYHCSTIVDCNTRKYHGLLVMPEPNLDDDNHVILSSLDETVIQHGAEFNLGLHKYEGGSFSPNGHKYIREYTMDTVPRTVYRVGGVILSKEMIFSRTDNQIMIKYTLMDAHSPTTLRFRPFMAFRSVKELTQVNGMADRSYEEVPNGIKARMYPGYADLYMQFNKAPKFVYEPYWYNGIEYPKEQERGYPYKEDLFVPGYFELPIAKGESIVFCGGDKPVEGLAALPAFFDAEVAERTPRSSFYNCLKNSAHQMFYIPRSDRDDVYLLAGYPWFKVRARDMFVSMTACTLYLGERERYERLMRTAIPALQTFMRYGLPDTVIREIDEPDVLLWVVWNVQQFALKLGVEEARRLYGDLIHEIIEYLLAQKHPNLILRDNGLLYTNGRERPVTWMNSVINGRPVVPRTGYIVEFNALYYNAKKFYQQMLVDSDQPMHHVVAERIEEECKLFETNFRSTFLNEYGYLFDYVDGQASDWSVRPNQLLAIALDFSPLTLKERKGVLDICTRELKTPKGIRSLSPKSGGYSPYYVGHQQHRDYAYHQGTAWPWLTGFYLEAYLRVYKMSGVNYIERQLIGFEEELFYHCVGTIPELFDGNPPFSGRGAISFAMNVSGILRAIRLLEKHRAEA